MTIRYRDSTEQERVTIPELITLILAQSWVIAALACREVVSALVFHEVISALACREVSSDGGGFEEMQSFLKQAEF